jgi:Ribbon-helix-helix protein, copG family
MTPGKISDKTTRTNIYISASAMANLKKLSEQNMGAPVAELIRRAIDEYLKAHLKKS